MPASPLDNLARELGLVAGRIERDAKLRIDAAVSDLRRLLAESELRLSTLERAVSDRLATVKDGAPGTAGADADPATIERVVGEHVARAIAALPKAQNGASVTVDDVAPLIVLEVGKAVAALPLPEKGDKGDPGERGAPGVAGVVITVDDVAPMIAAEVSRAVSAIPAAEKGEPGAKGEHGVPGASITVDDISPVITAEVAKAVAALPAAEKGDPGDKGEPGERGEPGASVTVDDVAPLIVLEVGKAVTALPVAEKGEPGAKGDPGIPGEAGASVTVDDVAPLIVLEVGKAVAALPLPEKGDKGDPGERGPAGMLPAVKVWTDTVHYEGEVRSQAGATYQALRDTAKPPPHDDWMCIAAAGRDGADGRSFRVRETFSAEVADYLALDVVALGGAAFVARRNNPGVCPGEGWQMISMQGKRGQPGERGAKGDRGAAGPAITGMSVDDQGLLTLINVDGAKVECDLYPVLSRLQG